MHASCRHKGLTKCAWVSVADNIALDAGLIHVVHTKSTLPRIRQRVAQEREATVHTVSVVQPHDIAGDFVHQPIIPYRVPDAMPVILHPQIALERERERGSEPPRKFLLTSLHILALPQPFEFPSRRWLE